jgi:hypothetical protein
LDIISSKINNINEDIFKANGNETLFVASVLIVNDKGDKKDRILILFPDSIVFLKQITHITPHEFDFDFKINFPIELKRIKTKAEDISNGKYCFELSNLDLSLNTESLLIVCATFYEMRMLTDLILAQLNERNKGDIVQISQKASQQISEIMTVVQSSQASSSLRIQNSSLSYKSNPNSQNNNYQISKQNAFKMFSIRPHPPLMPHFQLPGDILFKDTLNEAIGINLNQSCGGTLKRFMYKKPKLCEPYGKCKFI